ncbi:TlpA family protein disulfide reductase [Flavobacteriaceae bacterium M23B6Z8]
MKTLFTLITLILTSAITAQTSRIQKPEYVIIANEEIITKEQLEAFGEQGRVKSMRKGVSQTERDRLVEKLGERVGEREFIIKVELIAEKEIRTVKEKVKSVQKKEAAKKDRSHELISNINDLAPDFTVEMLDGEKVTLSNLRGNVVFINYWATWCAPCLMEFTEIPEKIVQPFKDKKLVFIPISIGESKEKVREKMQLMKAYGVNFEVAIDPEKDIWNTYATGAIPKSFLIDKKGVIRYISIGNSENNVDKLAAEIKQLLDE